MNIPKKKIVLVVGVFVFCIIGAMFFKIKAYKEKIDTTTIEAIDLRNVNDGKYKGFYDLDLVKATVSVTVKNNSIEKIELLKHEHGRGKKAEVLTDLIVQKQSLDLDVISGATASSKAILKATENALQKGIN